MSFLIVGGNGLGARGAVSYRGTDRERPPYCPELPEQSQYNRLALWYMEEGGQSLAVRDLARAKELLAVLRNSLKRPEFELVEVVKIGDSPTATGRLLGYDLSCGLVTSLLSWGLDLQSAGMSVSTPVRDLVAVVEAHFKPLLNEDGLFSDPETAAFCLRSMLALQAFWPGLWENEEASDFEIVGIHLLE